MKVLKQCRFDLMTEAIQTKPVILFDLSTQKLYVKPESINAYFSKMAINFSYYFDHRYDLEKFLLSIALLCQ